MISARVIADSITIDNVRLVTMQLSYPRFIHSEFLTHRVFSRNAASSRAIPIKKMIEQVRNNPAMPVYWGKNQSGMQAREELEAFEPHIRNYVDPYHGSKETEWVISPRDMAIEEWLQASKSAVEHAEKLVNIGAHKQLVNRLLEPWQEMQTIVTATEWKNFYTLRRHPDAQPEIKVLADAMDEAVANSQPRLLHSGDWHLPYVNLDISDVIYGDMNTAKKWSTARCARVSYLTHNSQTPDHLKDEELHDKLLESGHFSPFEHIATPGDRDSMYANFKGWKSYRFQLGF